MRPMTRASSCIGAGTGVRPFQASVGFLQRDVKHQDGPASRASAGDTRFLVGAYEQPSDISDRLLRALAEEVPRVLIWLDEAH